MLSADRIWQTRTGAASQTRTGRPAQAVQTTRTGGANDPHRRGERPAHYRLGAHRYCRVLWAHTAGLIRRRASVPLGLALRAAKASVACVWLHCPRYPGLASRSAVRYVLRVCCDTSKLQVACPYINCWLRAPIPVPPPPPPPS